MKTIFDLDITIDEMEELLGEDITEEQYLEQTRESQRIRDSIELLTLREEIEEARKLLEELPEDERLEWYPEGLRKLSDI